MRGNFSIPENVLCVCFLEKKQPNKQLLIYQQGDLLWLFGGEKQTNKHKNKRLFLFVTPKVGWNRYSFAILPTLFSLVFRGKNRWLFLLSFFLLFLSALPNHLFHISEVMCTSSDHCDVTLCIYPLMLMAVILTLLSVPLLGFESR